MNDKIQKIREELARLKEETSIGLSEHENGVEQGRMEIIDALSIFLDSMQEEPVSEDLGEATNNYVLNARKGYPRVMDKTDRYICNAFRAGTKWQKEQMMAKAIDATIEEPEPLLWEVLGELEGLFVVENNLHDGDGVKVIIVKED